MLATWSAWILQSAVELTLLLGLAWAFDRIALLRVRPQIRHVVWSVLLIRLLLPPDVVWPSFGATFRASVPASVSELAHGSGRVALLVWAIVAFAISAHWIVRAQRASTRLLKPPSGAPAAARAIDPQARTPYVTGLFRPRLVLPADWHRWQKETLAHAIEHELTHLRRRDLWIEALWMVAAALYWFHPLVHVARRRAHETREMCCDFETAARVGPMYRRSMLQLVTTLADRPFCTGAVSHAWNPAVARLLALERWQARGARVHAIAATALLGIAVLPGHWRLSHALDVPSLLDAQTRQELGLGSLHMRYLMMQRAQEH